MQVYVGKNGIEYKVVNLYKELIKANVKPVGAKKLIGCPDSTA